MANLLRTIQAPRQDSEAHRYSDGFLVIAKEWELLRKSFVPDEKLKVAILM